MAFRYGNKDTQEILRAAIDNKKILKDRPSSAGYTDGSPQKNVDPIFGGKAGTALGLGLDGDFGRYVVDPANQQSVTEYANLFYSSPINSDIAPPPSPEAGFVV